MALKMEMINLLQLAGLERFSSNIEQELGITTIKQLVDPNILYTKLKLIGMNECEIKKLFQTYKQNLLLKSPGYNSSLKKTRNNKDHTLADINSMPNDKNKNIYQIWKLADEDEKRCDKDCCNYAQTLDDIKKIEKVYFDFPNKFDMNMDEGHSPRSSCSSYRTSNSFDSSLQMANNVKGKSNQIKNILAQFVRKKKKPNLSIDLSTTREEYKESSEIKEMSEADMKELDLICDLANRFVNLSKPERNPHSPTSPTSKKPDSPVDESPPLNKSKRTSNKNDSSFVFKENKNIEASFSFKNVQSIIQTNGPNPNINLYRKKKKVPTATLR